MIYVPDLKYKCYVVTNSETIRAYEVMPYNPSGYNQTVSINYRDYYLNSNYLYQDGSQNFSSYTTLPVCLDKSKLTDDYFYRNDFDSILVIFFIICIFLFFIPLKLLSKLIKRGAL